ncbi:MAG: cbb3-type cytochrome c oxidase subunit 3 [Burkholderiaceae bacterium]|nr:cbb3-type cytochrome c oxidase subunit 3 [Burkholderiaceae bacterium]
MELTTFQIVWTVLSFVVFMAILFWACSKRARPGFDSAERLPFEDDGANL